MANLDSCPRCGREAKPGISHSWFPVHTCRACREKYCSGRDCVPGRPTCPACGSTDYSDYDAVHVR
jgi:hypothetical protein